MTDEELRDHLVATRPGAHKGTYREWEEAHGDCFRTARQYVSHPRVYAVYCHDHMVTLYWLVAPRQFDTA